MSEEYKQELLAALRAIIRTQESGRADRALQQLDSLIKHVERYEARGEGYPPMTEESMLKWLARKYVQQQDDRQKKMGLQYMTVETHDLARQLFRTWGGTR